MIAEVFLGAPLAGPFSYLVPDGLDAKPGMRARVDFNGRSARAFIIALREAPPAGLDPDRLKPLLELIDGEPMYDDRLIDLARHVSSTYLCAPGEVFAAAMPSADRPSPRYRIPLDRNEEGAKALTAGQETVISAILEEYASGRTGHLLFGVTGSGKTEVYISLARHFMQMGRSVLYLVPEISLSSQIFERLYNSFGDELVIYHSRLTAAQRLYNWRRFYRGESKIAIGTRSAVFMQCPSLGMIIVDEEHDQSYKEHSTPRYNARRIAAFRSSQEGALLVMGSATPSMESLHAARKGMFGLHRLKSRFGGADLPQISIVKLEHASRPADLISAELKVLTKRAIDAGHQAIYLLNRRGFSPFIVCAECGEPLNCPYCSIALTLHRGGSLLCHYCGFSAEKPAACPHCGHDTLDTVGSGTQRMEEAVAEAFPGARVFRLDQDSARQKNSSYDLVANMKSGKIDILLGTQMVSKGFDFHRVSVVGVLFADIGLSLPDFRAPERIYALLTQVAGRCGRGEAKGRVVVQTLNPGNEMLKFLTRHDYDGFADFELSLRKALAYPPFARLARVLVRGKHERKVIEAADSLARAMRAEIERTGSPVSILGPAPAPLEKIAANFRHHLILKSADAAAIRSLISSCRSAAAGGGLYLEIDIDPTDML